MIIFQVSLYIYKVYKQILLQGKKTKLLWYDYDRFNLDSEQNILAMLETELQNSRQYVIVEVNVDLKLWGMFDIKLWCPRGWIVVYVFYFGQNIELLTWRTMSVILSICNCYMF